MTILERGVSNCIWLNTWIWSLTV